MRRIAILGMAGALAMTPAVAHATSATTDALVGQWRTDDGKAVINIAPCGPALCGRITRFLVAEPAGGQRDANNPDTRLRTRPLRGLEILSGLTPKGAAWSGRGYSPEDGRSFNAHVSAAAGGRLSVKGCVSLFCRTRVWTRIN